MSDNRDVVFKMNTGGRPLKNLVGEVEKLDHELVGVFKSKRDEIRPDVNEVRSISELLAPGMKRYLKNNDINTDSLNSLGAHYKKKKDHRDDSHRIQRGNLSSELRMFKLTEDEDHLRKKYQTMNSQQLLRVKKLFTICTMEINLLLTTSEAANPQFQFEECIVQLTEEMNADRYAAMQKPPSGDSQNEDDVDIC